MKEETKKAINKLTNIMGKYQGCFYKASEQAAHDIIKDIVKKTSYLYKPNQTDTYKKHFKYFYTWLINECEKNGYLDYLKNTLYNYKYQPGELLYLLDHDAKIHNKLWL